MSMAGPTPPPRCGRARSLLRADSPGIEHSWHPPFEAIWTSQCEVVQDPAVLLQLIPASAARHRYRSPGRRSNALSGRSRAPLARVAGRAIFRYSIAASRVSCIGRSRSRPMRSSTRRIGWDPAPPGVTSSSTPPCLCSLPDARRRTLTMLEARKVHSERSTSTSRQPLADASARPSSVSESRSCSPRRITIAVDDSNSTSTLRMGTSVPVVREHSRRLPSFGPWRVELLLQWSAESTGHRIGQTPYCRLGAARAGRWGFGEEVARGSFPEAGRGRLVACHRGSHPPRYERDLNGP
ncbi:MAG: hypothetical protein QOD65_2495 [Gaiellales bacterium]|nr:hypothetical protein [Gaiellales bacterium]